ncbi:hypothetical protein I302_101752 [Kwoniella bestiolae CBS 10118]|uniref:Uncharacterized protein n=1 Tax=Kwoniella bestiolae CBS 10118 TaxID=1296100 RepID=A0A1B9GD44_9TREE|nr:hypothetical protein I302_00430 [Kwoniella bestiolae CBS 10118]OCF28940.1 hypothetical protein I302_00430 [Kwoniella bestiolae CBS 10118]
MNPGGCEEGRDVIQIAMGSLRVLYCIIFKVTYPDDRDYPPLRVIEADGSDTKGMDGEERGGRASAYGGNESEIDDDNPAWYTLDLSDTSQLSLIARRLDKSISQEANGWKHKPDRDPTARRSNIQKWKKRVVFCYERKVMTEIEW